MTAILNNPVCRVGVVLAPGAPPTAVADSVSTAEAGQPGSFNVLDAQAEVVVHVMPSPNTSTVTVRGLSEERATAWQQAAETARTQAIATGSLLEIGILTIEAGYLGSYGLIAAHQLLDIVYYPATGETVFTGLDGRVEWSERYPQGETLPGGTPLALVSQVMQAAQQPGLVSDADYKAAFAQALPEYQAKTANTAGVARFGMLLERPAGEEVRDLNDALGLEQVWYNNRPITMLKDRSRFDTAVVLNTRTGLISAQRMRDGIVQANCLLIHQLEPGRPVFLQTPEGAPKYGGNFRVASARFSASTRNGEHGVITTLQPVPLDDLS